MFLVFWIITALLLLQFPLHGSLMGDLDTWGNLAMFKHAGNWLTGHGGTTANFPVENIWASYGSTAAGIIHLFFNVLGFSDLWAYYLFMSIVVAANSWAVYLLISCFSYSRMAAFAAGLFFSFNNFVLAQLDNPNLLVLCLGILALYHLFGFFQTHAPGRLLWAAALSALQVYMSPYGFVFIVVAIVIVLLFNLGKLWSLLTPRLIVAAIVLPLVLLLPFLLMQFREVADKPINILQRMDIIHYLSLNLDDFKYALPNNVLGNFSNRMGYWWTSIIKCAFIGLILPALALLGALRAGKYRWMWLVIVLVGFLLALGPYVSVGGNKLFKAPFYVLYQSFGLENMIRVPIRAFLLSMLGLSVLAGMGLTALLQRFNLGGQLLVLCIVLAAYASVQIPRPFYKHDSEVALNYVPEYFDTLRSDEAENNKQVVMNLPSALFSFEGDRREYWYMYWQTRYRLNTVNGSLGFLNNARLKNDSLMRDITVPGNLSRLIDLNGVGVIVFHKKLAYTDTEKQQLEFLKQSNGVELTKEDDDLAWFRVK